MNKLLYQFVRSDRPRWLAWTNSSVTVCLLLFWLYAVPPLGVLFVVLSTAHRRTRRDCWG